MSPDTLEVVARDGLETQSRACGDLAPDHLSRYDGKTHVCAARCLVMNWVSPTWHWRNERASHHLHGGRVPVRDRRDVVLTSGLAAECGYLRHTQRYGPATPPT